MTCYLISSCWWCSWINVLMFVQDQHCIWPVTLLRCHNFVSREKPADVHSRKKGESGLELRFRVWCVSTLQNYAISTMSLVTCSVDSGPTLVLLIHEQHQHDNICLSYCWQSAWENLRRGLWLASLSILHISSVDSQETFMEKNTSTYISPTWRPSVNYLILTDSQPKLKTFTAVIVQLVTPYLISLSQRQRHQKKNNYITLTIVVSWIRKVC